MNLNKAHSILFMLDSFTPRDRDCGSQIIRDSLLGAMSVHERALKLDRAAGIASIEFTTFLTCRLQWVGRHQSCFRDPLVLTRSCRNTLKDILFQIRFNQLDATTAPSIYTCNGKHLEKIQLSQDLVYLSICVKMA